MDISARTPDRLYVSTKAKELVDHLDSLDYFGLGKASINRSELFLFAMALGAETCMETQVVNPYSGGLILDKSIDSKTRSIIYAQCLASLSNPDKELDSITDKSRVYKMAEQYANTGFEIIEDYVEKKKASDLVFDLFLELDDQYTSLGIADTNSSDVQYIYGEEPFLASVAEDGELKSL